MGTHRDLTSPPWHTVGVAVQGRAHRETGLPCQDAVAWTLVGHWLIAAVCDGAGSSPHADLGAAVGAQAVVEALATMPLPPVASSSWRTCVVDAVHHARTQVARALGDATAAPTDALLAMGHATLVAVVASPQGGVFAHIGDGMGAALTTNGAALSHPENGDYANETYFFTQPDWIEHLRLTSFDAPTDVLLLSDGAAALATTPDGTLLPGFIGPLTQYLSTVPEHQGRTALRDTLAHDRTAHLTDDDLTVFWARPAPLVV